MDKFEYKIKADEIKELIAQGEYEQAAEIADSIDWRRVKSVMMLCTVSDLYKICRRYEDSRDMLLLAYERHPGGRTIVYSLCELSIKMEEFLQAVEYYKEFVEIAPKDSGRYILQYKLYEAQDVSLEERIAVLEELKQKDYREKWAYELAYLYHRVGLSTKCVEECDELFLWFGNGKYVSKALELKMLHAPLTAEQQYQYDNRFNAEQAEAVVEQTPDSRAAQAEIPAQDAESQTVKEIQLQDDVMSAATTRIPAEEIDIHVKTLEVGKYDTINLQEELAAGIQEYFGTAAEETTARSIVAPAMDSATKVIAVGASRGADKAAQIENSDSDAQPRSEVFFGETGEVDLVEKDLSQMQDMTVGQVVEESRVLEAQPPREIADVLSMEADGQISFVLPEKDPVEKQITGQISINDIILEWERLKKENEEKRQEEVRQRVLQQTGRMFTEFEESVRDGLLEQLESGQAQAGTLDEQLAELFEDSRKEEQENFAENSFEKDVPQQDAVSDEQEIVGDQYDAEDIGEVEELTEIMDVTESAAAEMSMEADEESAEENSDIIEDTVEIRGEEFGGEAPGVSAEETEEEVLEVSTEEYGGETLEESADEYEGEALEVSTEEYGGETSEESADECEEESLEVSAEEYDGETSEESADECEEESLLISAEETEGEALGENAEETEEVSKMIVEEIRIESPEISGETEVVSEETAENAEVDAAEEKARKEETVSAAEKQAPVREKQKVRNLTREERELYGQYIQGRSSKEQIIKAVDGISMAAYTGNVIVTGDEGMDSLGLAKNMIREVQMTDSNFSGKIAKISGETLNSRDIKQIVDGLNNGALIIQKASRMSQQTADVLYNVLQQENLGIVVAMEDSRKLMDRFLNANQKLLNCFTARVDIAALSNDALVAFARKYAREKEYTIDQMGLLALHTRIEDMQTSDHAVTILEVKEIVDDAIRNADRKTIGHFFDVLFGRRYDDEDMIILKEKDFV